ESNNHHDDPSDNTTLLYKQQLKSYVKQVQETIRQQIDSFKLRSNSELIHNLEHWVTVLKGIESQIDKNTDRHTLKTLEELVKSFEIKIKLEIDQIHRVVVAKMKLE